MVGVESREGGMTRKKDNVGDEEMVRERVWWK